MINNEQISSNYKLRFLDDLGNSYPDWERKSFVELYFRCFSNKKSIQKNSFLKAGKYPIVSQEKNLINGYSDFEDENLITEPVIVFGDHTLSLKLIDFPFYKGADGIVLLKNKTNNENLTFLYQLLKLNLPHSQGYKRHFSVIKNKLLMIPSFAEQQKIGTFLSQIDNYIQLQKEEIDLTNEYKKSLLIEIFSQKIRFLDENGNNYSGWKENKIKDIFVVTRGSVLAKDKLGKDKTDNYLFPVYSSQTLNNGLLGYYNQYLFEDAITWTTDGANAGDFNFRQGKFYATNVCGILKSNEGYANTFMASLLKKEAKKYVIKLGNSKLMNNVVADISIFSPCIAEQQKIGTLLNNLDQQINQLELEFKNLNEYKNILLNKLIF